MKNNLLLQSVLTACGLFSVLNAEAFELYSANMEYNSFDMHIAPESTFAPLSTFQNILISQSARSRLMHELLMDYDRPSIEKLLGQIELSYYKNNGHRAKNSTTLGLHHNIDSYAHQRNLKNQRMLVESKFLTDLPQQYHPYVSIGLGQPLNSFSTTSAFETTDLSIGNTSAINSLSYLLSLGFEKELTSYTRVGAMYRWVNLSQMNQSLMLNNHMQVNEFSFQLSYQR